MRDCSQVHQLQRRHVLTLACGIARMRQVAAVGAGHRQRRHRAACGGVHVNQHPLRRHHLGRHRQAIGVTRWHHDVTVGVHRHVRGEQSTDLKAFQRQAGQGQAGRGLGMLTSAFFPTCSAGKAKKLLNDHRRFLLVRRPGPLTDPPTCRRRNCSVAGTVDCQRERAFLHRPDYFLLLLRQMP